MKLWFLNPLITPTGIPYSALQKVNLGLLALIPIALLFSRAVADGCVTLIAVSFLIHSFHKRHWQWASSSINMLLLLLAGIITFLVPLMAKDSSHAVLQGFLWLRFPLFFIAVREWLLLSLPAVSIIAISVTMGLLIAWIDTFVQFLTGVSLSGNVPFQYYRLTGPLSGPVVGMYMARMIWLLIAAYSLTIQATFFRKILLMIGVMAVTLLVFCTGERSASLLLLSAMCVVGMFVLFYQPKARIALLVAFIGVGGALSLLISQFSYLQQRVNFLIAQIQHFKTTEYGQLWKAAWILWQENPLFGIGIDAFRTQCLPLKEQFTVMYCNLHPHNFYLEWLTGAGLIGVGILSVWAVKLLISIVTPLVKHKNVISLWPIFGAIGTWWMIFFPLIATQSFFSNWPGVLLWFSLAVSVACAQLAIIPSKKA